MTRDSALPDKLEDIDWYDRFQILETDCLPFTDQRAQYTIWKWSRLASTIPARTGEWPLP